MKRHPSPGASGLRQFLRGMSRARTVGSPPYHSINGWRLRRAAVCFKSWSVGPTAPLKITLPALSRLGELPRPEADWSPTVGRELCRSDALRPSSAPVRAVINTRRPRTAQLALAGQEAARGAE